MINSCCPIFKTIQLSNFSFKVFGGQYELFCLLPLKSWCITPFWSNVYNYVWLGYLLHANHQTFKFEKWFSEFQEDIIKAQSKQQGAQTLWNCQQKCVISGLKHFLPLLTKASWKLIYLPFMSKCHKTWPRSIGQDMVVMIN